MRGFDNLVSLCLRELWRKVAIGTLKSIEKQRRDFSDGGNIRAVGLAYGSWWDSFIGNVLGRPGQMSGWSYTDPAMSCDANGYNCTGNNANWGRSDIWRLGYDPERWSMNPDPQTLSTVIRDGNYDFLTNSQRWHNTPRGASRCPIRCTFLHRRPS